MEANSDHALLKRFGQNREETAFSELVSRHVDFVYSVALRQVRSTHLAEEVAQTVFTELAQLATKLPPGTVLNAWLFQVTRRRSIDVIRSESRRRMREQKAVELHDMDIQESNWKEIEPFIDEALEKLNQSDRHALILRYYNNQSLRNVGEALGCGEDAAQKRVQRAVQRLGNVLNKMKFRIGTAGLASFLSSEAITAAPVHLTQSIVQKALLQSIVSSSIATLSGSSTQTLVMTTVQKTITAAILTVGIGTGMLGLHQANHWKSTSQTRLDQDAARLLALEKDLEEARASLKVAASEIDRLKENQKDLHRLRADATKYRVALENLQKKEHTRPEIEARAKTLVERVHTLKSNFELQPHMRIPEMALIKEKDWIQAARHPINNEGQLRRSMSEIRGIAENRLVHVITDAIKDFKKTTNEAFPASMKELAPFISPPFDEIDLGRWKVASSKEVMNIQMGGEKMITQREAIDDVFDQKFVIGDGGFGASDFLSLEIDDMMAPVYNAYANDHHGNHPKDLNDYFPYVVHDTQRIALEKRIFRDSIVKSIDD